MSDDDNWSRSHTNAQGYDVNVFGYDKDGQYRGSNYPDTPSNSYNNWNKFPRSISGSGSKSNNGLFFIAVIIGIGFLIEKYGNIILTVIICGVLLVITFIVIRKIKKGASNQSNIGFTGKSKETLPNGNVYEGDFVNGYWHGKGKLNFVNGDIYEGEFINNTFNGKGKLILENGTIYEGDFVDGIEHGKGKIIWANNAVYEGDFFEGERHGKGKITCTNGDIYEGDFAHNEFNGKGKITCTNGEMYEGDFVNGNFHGKGKYTFADGTIKEGIFKDGEFVE